MNQILSIGSIDVRQDDQGRFCLTDLFRASGGLKQDRPNYWLANKQTQALMAELSKAGIPALVVAHGGNKRGTYVCRELVYSYAMWISAAFHIQVIRAYDVLVSGKIVVPSESPAPAARERALEAELAQTRDELARAHRNNDAHMLCIGLLQQPVKPKRRALVPFTPNEIRHACAMKAQGKTNSEIARTLGRSVGSVSLITRSVNVG